MNPGATITITLESQTEKANAAIQSFFRGLGERVDFVSKLNKQLENGSHNVNQLAAAFGALIGIGAMKGFVQEAINAGRAAAQLEAALKSTGQASADYRKELEGNRKALANKIGVDDDELLSVQRLLVQFGVQAENMKELTALTMDYAAAMNQDAMSAATNLGRALQGQDVQLRGMRIQLDQTLPKAQQLQMLMAILQKQVGGQAEAMADPVKKFNAQLKQTEQALGRIVLDTLVTPFLKSFGEGLGTLEEKLKAFQQDHPILVNFFRDAAAATGRWLGYLAPAILLLAALVLGFKSLQLALTPIGPLLNLMRLGLAAVAGADVIGLLAQVRNYRDLAAALDLIVKNTALARFGLIGLAAAAGYGAGRLLGSVPVGGKTVDEHVQSGFGKLFFSGADATSATQTRAKMDEYEATLIRVIDKQTESGRLTHEQATAFAIQAEALRSGNLSLKDYYDGLSNVAASMRKVLEVSKTSDEKDFLFDAFLKKSDRQQAELAAGKSAAMAPLMLAEIELANAQNEAAYKLGEIGLQQYLNKRRYLIDSAAKAESIPLEKEIGVVTQQLTDQEKALDELIKKSDEIRAKGGLPDYQQIQELQDQVNKLTVERRKLQAQLSTIETGRVQSQTGVDTEAARPGFGATMAKMADDKLNGPSFGAAAANAFADSWNTSIDGVSSNISGMILGMKSFGQAALEVGNMALTAFVGNFVKMGVEWVNTHVFMKAISTIFRTTETAEQAAHTTTQVGIHAAGEETKTGWTAGNALKRGAIRLGETIFHGIQVAIRTAAHLAGEIFMTAVTIAQVGIRIGLIVLETVWSLIKAAMKGASAVADIPYVGPILALAAMGAILGAGFAAMSGHKEGGYTGDGPVDEVAGHVHRQEVVIPAHRVRQWGLGPLMSALRTGDLASLVPGGDRGVAGAASMTAVVAQGAGAGAPQIHHTTELTLLNSIDPVEVGQQWADSHAGDVWFNHMLKNNIAKHQR
jgi:hypothetical protein